MTRQSTAPRPVTPAGILAAKLDRIRHRLDAADVDPGLRADLREACELAEGLDPYLSRCTTPESPALRSLADRTRAHDWALEGPDDPVAPLEQEMLSGHVEGQLLKVLVHATRARRVLDIGMFSGYSALAMAEALPDDGQVVACEVDAGVAAFAQQCFRESADGGKIMVHVGPAADTLARCAAAGDRFDLVFIDADKPGYTGYVNAVLDGGLLAPNGLICVDNTLMQGQPYVSGTSSANGVAVAAFNRAVADDPRVAQVVVPLRDGITLMHRV